MLKYANRSIFADSLLKAYDEKIETLDKIIINKNGQILLADEVIRRQIKEIDKLNKDVKKLNVVCIALGFGVLTETIIIIFKK